MKPHSVAFSIFAAAMVCLLSGCGSLSSAHPSSGISVAFTPSLVPPASMNTSSKALMAATVSDDSKNLGVTWSVACENSQCGSFSPVSTASTHSTQFTAPSAIPGGNTVVITATSVADSTKSVSTKVTITRQAPISVTIAPPPPASVNVGSATSITAVVVNDSNNAGVNWSVACAGTACGSFATANPVASGSSATYDAPSSIPAGNTVTVTATSVTDSTKSASATITITQSVPISVTINPTPRAYINTGATAPFTAVVANDPNNAGVNWSVSCADVSCGSFITANPVASGSAATYDAPSSIPAGNTVTMTATSVTDNTKSASATVTIIQAAPTLPDGTYVFHLNGTDFTNQNGESNYHVVGAFTVASGAITAGEQDFVDYYDAPPTDQISTDTSYITNTPDGNLQIVLDTGDSFVGVNGVETITASPVSNVRALIAETDTFASGTGTLDMQTSQSAPAGGYAFFASGIDSSATPIGFGGVLNVDGSGSISGSGSVFDLNDAFSSTVLQNQSFSPSTVQGPGGSPTPDSFGRVVFVLNPANNTLGSITLIGYIVDYNTIQLIETIDDLGGTTGGTALSQGGNVGAFSSNNVSGSTFVMGANGVDSNGPLQLAGALNFDSATNNVSGSATFNDIANQLSGAINSGTYAVDSSGRVTLSGLNGQAFNDATVQLYLDGNGNAFALSMDASDVTAGYGYQQNPYASFSGNYAVSAQGFAPTTNGRGISPVPWNASGQIFVDGNLNVTGFTDFDVLSQSPTADVNLVGATNGSSQILTGNLAGLGVASSTASDRFTYYIIDFQRAFGIETDSTQLGLLYTEQPPPSK